MEYQLAEGGRRAFVSVGDVEAALTLSVGRDDNGVGLAVDTEQLAEVVLEIPVDVEVAEHQQLAVLHQLLELAAGALVERLGGDQPRYLRTEPRRQLLNSQCHVVPLRRDRRTMHLTV